MLLIKIAPSLPSSSKYSILIYLHNLFYTSYFPFLYCSILFITYFTLFYLNSLSLSLKLNLRFTRIVQHSTNIDWLTLNIISEISAMAAPNLLLV